MDDVPHTVDRLLHSDDSRKLKLYHTSGYGGKFYKLCVLELLAVDVRSMSFQIFTTENQN